MCTREDHKPQKWFTHIGTETTDSLYFCKEDGDKAVKMPVLGWTSILEWTRYLKVKPLPYLKIIYKIRSKQFSWYQIENLEKLH